MSHTKPVYQWTKQDRVLHLLPAIPLIAYYVGSIYLLAMGSIYLVVIFLLLWVGVNVFAAGICAGCPYRGGYCPGVCQLYFAPFLSTLIYKGRVRDSRSQSFKANLLLIGAFGMGSYVFGFYWLFRLYWHEHPIIVLGLLALLLIHMPLSFFLLCPKCSYNDTCPMANVYNVFQKKSDFNRGAKGS